MIFHWPQITVGIWLILTVGLHLAKHGQPKDGKYGFFSSLFRTSLFFWFLYKGGFFLGVSP